MCFDPFFSTMCDDLYGFLVGQNYWGFRRFKQWHRATHCSVVLVCPQWQSMGSTIWSCRVLNMPIIVSVCPQSSPSFCVFSSSLSRVILSFVLSSAFHSDRSSIVRISFGDLSFGNYVVRKPPDRTIRKLVYGHSTVSYVSMKWPPCPKVTFLFDVTPLTMTNAALQSSKDGFH